MRRLVVLLLLLLLGTHLVAQEVLAPLQSAERCSMGTKNNEVVAVKLPFFDDFANYTGSPNPRLWLNQQAYVNSDFALFPPTIGMVTLDCLDAQGEVYAHASIDAFSSDTLLSQPIRLDSLFVPFRKKMQPSDSVYLSFYYLPGGGQGEPWEGLGDCPEEGDSLFLEFYNPAEDQWTTVWSIGGISVDSLEVQTGTHWQYVSIPITEWSYFSSQFQFRFRNYCSLDVNPKLGIVGNSDQWNLDYIYLDYNRSHNQKTFRDIAFVHKATSMLEDYTAVPFRQFRPSQLRSNTQARITNLYNSSLSSFYSYDVIDEADGSILKHYDGGYDNVPSFFQTHQYQTNAAHASAPIDFVFPEMAEPKTYRIQHVVREGVGGDNHLANDTTVFYQVFDNYFAYDDGVPENGYGLTTSGGKMFLSCRFDLSEPDTLTALDLYFNRTRNKENADVKFILCVWSDNGGKPGDLIYRDEVKSKVDYHGINRYCRYPLQQPVLVQGTVYVGFEQVGNDFINLGFDRSNDTRNRIFYRTSSQWQNSILMGSLMLRPCFGESALVGITHPEQVELPEILVYPNPSKDKLFIRFSVNPEQPWTYTLIDLQGRMLKQGNSDEMIDLSGYAKGLYLLKITHPTSGQQILKKIALQ